MTEIEYIKATNHAKLQMVQMILRDILEGEDCGITCERLLEIVVPLTLAIAETSKGCEINEHDT